MALTLHVVLFAFLAVALAWNLGVVLRGAGPDRSTAERWTLLPLQLLLSTVLVRDRLWLGEPAWLETPLVAHLFVLLFAGALVQNVAAIRARGARLTDIPVVLFNVGVGTCQLLADMVLVGVDVGPDGAALLHGGSVLQLLLGTRIADGWTLSWLVPLLLPRTAHAGVGSLLASLVVAALAAFGPLALVLLHPASRDVVASFAAEPTPGALRDDLLVGVSTRPDLELPGGAPPGGLTAWVLPADHDGTGLPEPTRPLLLELTWPTAWNRSLPPLEERMAVMKDGAERLATALRPEVLLPFPEPDGSSQLTWLYREPLSPEAWVELLREVRGRVRARSPETKIAVRLAADVSQGADGSPWSRELAQRLVEDRRAVDAIGPRLSPGGAARGGAALATTMLDGWRALLGQTQGGPELWVLAAGASPLAVGERAQRDFVEGCLARADAAGEVVGVVIEGWHDAGHTRGLLRLDGSPRRAATRVRQLTGESPPGLPDR